jgi:hypothetical protein
MIDGNILGPTTTKIWGLLMHVSLKLLAVGLKFCQQRHYSYNATHAMLLKWTTFADYRTCMIIVFCDVV